MASAIQLVASDTINNGHGLAPNADILAQIGTLQSQAPIGKMVEVFGLADTADANIVANLYTVLNTLGTGVNHAQWLIDIYPGNITATSTAGVAYYGTNGNTAVARFTTTINNQVSGPFAHGLNGFANTYSAAIGYSTSAFDIIGSANILQNKTYAQSGLGYTGPLDLATNGLGSSAQLLANVVGQWGTMYDVHNISTLADPYVFGQNLLNQGLGSYGNLSDRLTAAGLNIYNLSQVPPATTTVTQQLTTTTVSTPVGAIDFPDINTVTTVTTSTGNSVDTVLSIYQSVTGANLSYITSAANITVANASISTLADYLDLNKITSAGDYSALAGIGITSLAGLGAYLQSRIGSGYYTSWQDVVKLLRRVEVPTLYNTTSTASSKVVSDSIINSIKSRYGTGSGPFGNPTLIDYLGATAGMPGLVANFVIINNNYLSLSSGLLSLVTTLKTKVNDYINSYSPGGGDPDISAVQTAVNSINSFLNSVNGTAFSASSKAYYDILQRIATEVANCATAGVQFNAGYSQALTYFGQQIAQLASDKTVNQTYQFFANIITRDQYGDTIRLAVAEAINTVVVAAGGITMTNDPNPALVLANAQAQNIPLSTYLSQNK
jgi:hypothetical protein